MRILQTPEAKINPAPLKSAVTGIRPSAAYTMTISVSLLLIAVWLLIASRRVYGVSWLNSAIKTVLIEAGYLGLGLLITFFALALAVDNLARLR